jgi:hypothetical protein
MRGRDLRAGFGLDSEYSAGVVGCGDGVGTASTCRPDCAISACEKVSRKKAWRNVRETPTNRIALRNVKKI